MPVIGEAREIEALGRRDQLLCVALGKTSGAANVAIKPGQSCGDQSVERLA